MKRSKIIKESIKIQIDLGIEYIAIYELMKYGQFILVVFK